MKTSREALPLVAVGGGAFLVPDQISGISRVLRPEQAGVANAIGAALAQVGAEAEVVYKRGGDARERALARATDEATDKAVRAGAAREGIEIIDVEETPMAYLAEPAVRLRVKAVGETSP